MPLPLRLFASGAALLPLAALAHDSAAAMSGGAGWRMEAWVALLLAASALFYARGVAVAWRRAGTGRAVAPAQVAAFALGWLATFAALAPPIDPLATQRFSMHMVQHELLMVVAGPLLVLGRPFVAWSWAWPAAARGVRRAFAHPALAVSWRGATSPVGAWLLHAAALWTWHAPVFFDAALVQPLVHDLQHACFFATGLLFWWSVLGRSGVRHRAAGLLSLFTTLIHTGVLAALLTLSPRVWYAPYVHTAAELGFDPLADQQLGGLLMWVPAGAVYLLVALALAARMLSAMPAAPGPVRG